MVSFCLILLFKRISNYPLSTISLMHLGNTQTAVGLPKLEKGSYGSSVMQLRKEF